MSRKATHHTGMLLVAQANEKRTIAFCSKYYGASCLVLSCLVLSCLSLYFLQYLKAAIADSFLRFLRNIRNVLVCFFHLGTYLADHYVDIFD